MITIEQACYLYALLTEASIDLGSLVTAMMMLIGLTDQGITLPHGAQIIHIPDQAELCIRGMKEFRLEKGPIRARFLNANYIPRRLRTMLSWSSYVSRRLQTMPYWSSYRIILWDPWTSETTTFTALVGVEGA